MAPRSANSKSALPLRAENLAELIEQAAAYSGADQEALAADRIARQEELKKLVALRDAQRGK